MWLGLPNLSNAADAEAGSMNPCSLRVAVTVVLPDTPQASQSAGLCDLSAVRTT